MVITLPLDIACRLQFLSGKWQYLFEKEASPYFLPISLVMKKIANESRNPISKGLKYLQCPV